MEVRSVQMRHASASSIDLLALEPELYCPRLGAPEVELQLEILRQAISQAHVLRGKEAVEGEALSKDAVSAGEEPAPTVRCRVHRPALSSPLLANHWLWAVRGGRGTVMAGAQAPSGTGSQSQTASPTAWHILRH